MMRIACIILALFALLAEAALAAGPRYRLEVAGLACPFCAYGIEKSLQAVDGVEAVETNLEDGAVIVTMEDEATLDETRAARAVDDAGFTLGGFEELSVDQGR